MLAVSHRTSLLAAPSVSRSLSLVMDESGTINPAALNAHSNTIAPSLLSQSSPRGIKRGRSDESEDTKDYSHSLAYGGDDLQSSKRNKPYNDISGQMLAPVQTPQIKTEALPLTSPAQTSPPQRTPGSASKPTVVKALPTVRDHTTDQLNEAGDEFNYREIDESGEKKVSPNGHPADNRKYKCRTFKVPKRGEKLFMLATECARVLGYRDSYLLFNKNRSLFKIIASQEEKDNLIHQEILPYSYRSRQIAIVTARSMFRQFGSRLIENGRRVRDDYWEAKARKQGFTEEDPAGEKRPGAAKAREREAALQAEQPNITIAHNGLDGGPYLQQQSLAPLPMVLADGGSVYGNSIRPRQELTGPPYTDRTQSSNAVELMSQANQAAEWNKQLAATRQHRTSYLNDYWRRPHEQPVSQATTAEDVVATQNLTSPPSMQPGHRIQHDIPHTSSQMMSQMYSAGYNNPQNPMASPVQGMHRSLPGGQMHQGSPAMQASRQPSYSTGYPQPSQMWQQTHQQQPQSSPVPQSHGMPQYAGQAHASMPPPQMAGQPGMQYGQMNPAFAGMNRNMYQQSPAHQQFNMQQTSQGMQGWNQQQYGQGF